MLFLTDFNINEIWLKSHECKFCIFFVQEGDVSPFATTPNPSKSAKTIGEKSASDLDNDDL